MAFYMVGYDLKEGENYDDLTAELRGFGNWWHCLTSTWIIESDLTARQVRDRLWRHMKPDDRLLVMYYLHSKEGGSAAWKGFMEPEIECQEWLKTRL